MKFLNNYKTYIVALITAILPYLSEQILNINWVQVLTHFGVSSNMVIPLGGFIAGVVMAAMRLLTQITTVKEALYTEPPKEV